MGLYTKGFSHATSLVRAGKVDRTSSWSYKADDFSREDHLYIDKSADADTKGAYKYPVAKSGKVYRRGVIAAKARAAQQGEKAVESAANQLLEAIDKKDEKKMSKEAMPIRDGESIEEYADALRQAAVNSGLFGKPNESGMYDLFVLESRDDTAVIRDYVSWETFRTRVERDADGNFSFSDIEPVQERKVFEPKQIIKEDEIQGLATAIVLNAYESDMDDDWFPPSQVEGIARRFLKESREIYGPGHKPGPDAAVTKSWTVPYPSQEDYDKAMAVKVVEKEDGTLSVDGEPHRVFAMKVGDGVVRSGDWVLEVQAQSAEDRAKLAEGAYDAYSYGGDGKFADVEFDPKSLISEEIKIGD